MRHSYCPPNKVGLCQIKLDCDCRGILPKSGPNKGKVQFLSRNALSTYESGRQTPSLYLLRGLAAALGVSPGWLAFGEDSERISNPSRHASSAGQRPKFGVSAVSDLLSA